MTEEHLKGVARIRQEFLVCSLKHIAVDTPNEDLLHDSELEEQGGTKKVKLENGEVVKKRGQNKNRPQTARQDKSEKLCPTLMNVAEDETPKPCVHGEKCQFEHDIKKYLQDKPGNLPGSCYVYRTYGRCPKGATCRFGSEHLTPEGRNIVNKEIWDPEWTAAKNFLSNDLMISLRKKKYDLSKSEDLVKDQQKKSKVGDIKSQDMKNETEANVGPISDEDLIRIRNEEKRKIDWKGKLYLAPLTTVGNLPFRRICKKFGADITCGEMAVAENLLNGGKQEWALVRRHESEDIFGVQICGNNPYLLTKCAQMLEENISMDFLDINCGCPIDIFYEKGAGSGLMTREKPLTAAVECMTKVLSCPLTVKMRTGVQSDKNIAHKLIPKLKGYDVSLFTVHGRSREQRYTKLADWDYIEECAKVANPIPLFGNGDVLSYEDYNAGLSSGNVSGVMMARGALIKPWIFQEIKEQRHIDMPAQERLDVLKDYANYGLEHWGSDTQGVETTRRFMLEWISFLHRYIPFGVLEVTPQKINDRPPPYKGRNELETLMASGNYEDWIKLSEIVLGPVPSGFAFLPKHKANAWK